jgi:hypothetical protein
LREVSFERYVHKEEENSKEVKDLDKTPTGE